MQEISSSLSIRRKWKDYFKENRSNFRRFNDFHDLCSDSMKPVRPMDLPWELVSKILNILYGNYLYTFNFDLALELFGVNKTFLREKYKAIFEESQKASYILYSQLRATFRLLEDIHDNYITGEIYTGNRKPYIRVESRSYSASKIWEYRFDNIIVMYNDMRPIYSTVFRNNPYSNPITYGGQVMLDVTEDMEIDNVYYPLIDILFADQSGQCNQDFDSLITGSFSSFGVLLKQIYAPYARVRFVVTAIDENPFLVNPNSFLEIN